MDDLSENLDSLVIEEAPEVELVKPLPKVFIARPHQIEINVHILQNSEISIPIAVIQLPEEVDAKVRAKTPEILEITEIEEEKVPIQNA